MSQEASEMLSRGRTSSESNRRNHGVAQTSVAAGTLENRPQRSKEGARESLQLIRGDRLIIAVLRDTKSFEVAIDCLSHEIEASLSGKPKDRLLGLIVYPKGKMLAPGKMNDRIQNLARRRILVRRSGSEDMLEGALRIKKEVLEQYGIAAEHSIKRRTGPFGHNPV